MVTCVAKSKNFILGRCCMGRKSLPKIRSYCSAKGLFCAKQIKNCIIDKDGQCSEEKKLLYHEVELSYKNT